MVHWVRGNRPSLGRAIFVRVSVCPKGMFVWCEHILVPGLHRAGLLIPGITGPVLLTLGGTADWDRGTNAIDRFRAPGIG